MQSVNAYSIPAAPVTSGSPIIFDVNGTQNGSAISHTANTSEFTVTQTGVYFVIYSGTAAPGTGTDLPAANLLSIQLDGTDVQGGQLQNLFTTASEDVPQTVSAIVNVPSAPATIKIVSSGGTFNYSSTSFHIFRIGDLPA